MNDFERSQVFDIYYNMYEAYFLLRDFGKAEEAENNACRLARSIKDKSGNMHLLESMGNRAFNLGYFERAIDHYKSAVLMAHELKDAGSAVRMLKSMGYVYLSLHAAEDIFKVLNEALSLSKEHGLTYYIIDTLTAIGYAEENEDRYKEALVNYEEALNLSESSEEFALLAVTCRKSIAGINAAKGEIGEAIHQLSEARAVHHSRGLIRDEIYDLMELGVIAHKAEDYAKSKQFYEEAFGMRPLA